MLIIKVRPEDKAPGLPQSKHLQSAPNNPTASRQPTTARVLLDSAISVSMVAEPPGPLGPTQSVPDKMVEEKPVASASAVADVTTKEEQAEQDAKLRPEREANLGDYFVSIPCCLSVQS